MAEKKTDKKIAPKIEDLEPPRGPKGGATSTDGSTLRTPLRPEEGRGGWDGNHNVTATPSTRPARSSHGRGVSATRARRAAR